MEEAGYSQEQTVRAAWSTMYESDTWLQTAKLLRDQLEPPTSKCRSSRPVLGVARTRSQNGNSTRLTLGWICHWARAGRLPQAPEPRDVRHDSQPRPNRTRTSRRTRDAAQRAISAWETVQNNPAPTDQAQQARNDAYVTMEEANWETMASLPVYHETTPRFWYEGVDIPPFGVAGDYKQKFNQVSIGG